MFLVHLETYSLLHDWEVSLLGGIFKHFTWILGAFFFSRKALELLLILFCCCYCFFLFVFFLSLSICFILFVKPILKYMLSKIKVMLMVLLYLQGGDFFIWEGCSCSRNMFLYDRLLQFESWEENFLNKLNELITKCRHDNKFYLANYKNIPP